MNKFVTLICLLFFVSSQGQHLIFDSLLKTNVDENGMVDYQSFKKNEALLDDYLVALQKTKPSENWSLNKQKAYWLNTYNAYTIKIILANYPIQSIKEIKKKGNVVWKIPFIKIGEKKYTLDWIEHEVLRKKFNDPRIWRLYTSDAADDPTRCTLRRRRARKKHKTNQPNIS